MANLTFENATLKIVYETGIDEYGDVVYSSRSYKNVRSNVTAEQLAVVVQAFIQLSNYPVVHATLSTTEKIDL